MGWSTEFNDLMPDGVSIKSVVSVSTDGYGTEVFGTASTYKARVVRKQTLVRTVHGTEELANTTVYVASTSTFAASAQVTVNSTLLGPIMAMEAFPDEDGVHHQKLYFG